MVAFISIILAITTLLVTVYALHKYQNFEVGINAERSIPLPPLGDQATEIVKTELVANSDVTVNSNCETPKPDGWMKSVANLKAASKFEEAMALCQAEFPLWSAYNQATIILRRKLKLLAPDDPQTNTTLLELYRTAVIAEILHEKSASSTHLTLTQLKQLSLDEIDGLDIDYNQLGYANLRLIRKSDVKIMLALWGRPNQHSLPRSLHQDWWNSFTSRV